jgi:predicted AAA+ superfamily ATPase
MRIDRYDIKGKEHLKTNEKYYVGDPSLVYAVMGYQTRFISGILENIVFLEMERRDYHVSIGKIDTKEVDFIAEKDGGKIYVQVAYQLNHQQDAIEREFGILKIIPDHYPKYVVTMDDYWEGNIEGIRHVHLADFLCMDSW